MIPNLHAVIAEAPGLLKGYQELHGLFANSSFNENELTVVWQTANVYHSCHYCVPAHTAIAKQMDADDSITEQLKKGDAGNGSGGVTDNLVLSLSNRPLENRHLRAHSGIARRLNTVVFPAVS